MSLEITHMIHIIEKVSMLSYWLCYLTPPLRRVHTGQVPVERLLEVRPGMRAQLPLKPVAHLSHLPRAVQAAYGSATSKTGRGGVRT